MPGPDTPPGPVDPGPVDPAPDPGPGPIDPGPQPPPGPKPDPKYIVVQLQQEMELAECRTCAALVRNIRGQRNLHTASHQVDRRAPLRRTW